MHVNSGIPESGLYGAAKPVGDGSKVPWRLSPEPIAMSAGAVKTLEGLMNCELGYWIIKGVKGEFYPCKPDIFEATYEQA